MKGMILSIVKLGLPLSVFVSMFAQGLRTQERPLAFLHARPWLILQSLAVVLVAVPLAVLGVLLALRPSAPVAVGLAIVASSPAAPMMMVKLPRKGGSAAYATCLHLCLALLAIATVPVTLEAFAAVLGFEVKVPIPAVARIVGMTILLPVCAGILVRRFFPGAAGRLAPAAGAAGGAALAGLFVLVIAMTFRLLLQMDIRSYVVMAVVVVASAAIGHWLGPGDPQERTTLAMESASRHPGLAMTIATLNFDPQKALPVLVPYVVVFAVITTIYLQWRKRAAASLDVSAQ